jgi:hypothetical protein
MVSTHPCVYSRFRLYKLVLLVNTAFWYTKLVSEIWFDFFGQSQLTNTFLLTLWVNKNQTT